MQKEFRRVAQRDLQLRLRWNVTLKMAKSCVVTAVFTAFLLLMQRGFAWWQTAIFAYCSLLNHLMTDFWVLASDAFILTADEIEKNLREVGVCRMLKCSLFQTILNRKCVIQMFAYPDSAIGFTETYFY
jgi:hypothetical protein